MGIQTMFEVVRNALGGRKEEAPGVVVVNPSDGTASGGGYRAAPTVTRPANATPYSAGDVVGGATEFTNMGAAGGHILVTGTDLMVHVAALPSGMGSFRLHLYDAAPPSAIADNAAWDLPAGDRDSYLGYVDMGTPVDVGGTLYVQQENLNRQFKLGAAQTSLWGYLVTAGAFTPAGNSEVYKPRLRAVGI